MYVSIIWMLAIYFIIWWLTLFVTLPFGVRSQHEDGGGVPGSDPGAPVTTHMGRKLVWTTFIATIVFGLGQWGYRSGALTIEQLAGLMGF
jgi:predicted secreted protein